MSQCHVTEDPEPSLRIPAGPVLLVPVRSGPAGCTARFFRTALGDRTAVGFTTEQRLVRALGPGQRWIRLSEPALRALAAPLGVTILTVDPPLSSPALTAVAPVPVERIPVAPAAVKRVPVAPAPVAPAPVAPAPVERVRPAREPRRSGRSRLPEPLAR